MLALLSTPCSFSSAQVGYIACTNGQISYVCHQDTQECGIESASCRCLFGYFPSNGTGSLVCTQASTSVSRPNFSPGGNPGYYLRRDYADGLPVASETAYYTSDSICNGNGFQLYQNNVPDTLSPGCYCAFGYVAQPGAQCVSQARTDYCSYFGMMPRVGVASCSSWYEGFTSNADITLWEQGSCAIGETMQHPSSPQVDPTPYRVNCDIEPYVGYSPFNFAQWKSLLCYNGDTQTIFTGLIAWQIFSGGDIETSCLPLNSFCVPNYPCIEGNFDDTWGYSSEFNALNNNDVLSNLAFQSIALQFFSGCVKEGEYLPTGSTTCFQCTAFCEPGYEHCVNNQCVCKDGYTRSISTGLCNPPACPPNLHGSHCDLTCPTCSAVNSACVISENSVSCGCTDPTQLIDLLGIACTNKHCGVDRSNLCSGSGVCIQGYQYEYCMCDRGRNGSQCEFTQSNGDECDCGVRWDNGHVVDSKTPLPSGIYILDDCGGMPYCPSIGYLGRNGFVGSGAVPVGSVEQAQYLCYKDGFCDGFTITNVLQYWSMTSQPQHPNPVFIAIFFSSRVGITPLTAADVSSSTRFYLIDRSSAYRCTSLNFDLQFYYSMQGFQNVANIYQYCRSNVNYTVFLPPCNVDQSYWPTRYYRYVGHLARASPNAGCDLLPVIYDPYSYCGVSRCLTVGYNQPCNGNGYCVQDADNSYSCQCKTFFTSNIDSSRYGLNGQPAWIGSACQFSVAELCVAGQEAVLCSGYQQACKAKKAWDGEFFLLNFADGFHDDYIPACDCTGLPAKGQYCEETLCGTSCQLLGPDSGSCMLNPTTGAYACQCGVNALGTYCEIDASACVYNGLQCAGHGTCIVNGTTTNCICSEGFKGVHCENSDCPSSLMIPGHGDCTNNILTRCFPVYTGTRCEVDNCAFWGGYAKSTSSCVCDSSIGYANLFNGAVVPTCWPQCPTPINSSIVCGDPTSHCYQHQSDSSRYAECQCGSQYILNPSTGLCTGRCGIHGTYSTSLKKCQCNTGYTGSLCDQSVCSNGGVYSFELGQCSCPEPYTTQSQCTQNTCGNNGVVIGWETANATSLFQCSCRDPYRPFDETEPFNCAGDLCGDMGTLYPFWQFQTRDKWCVCDEGAVTILPDQFCVNFTASGRNVTSGVINRSTLRVEHIASFVLFVTTGILHLL